MSFNVGSIVGDASSVVPGGSLVAGLGSDLVSLVGGKPSSASIAVNSGALPKLLQLGMGGNLTAVKILYDRSTTVGVASERAQWVPYLEQLEAAHPSYVALANQEVPPHIGEGSPDEVLQRAVTQAIYVTPGQATSGPTPPPATVKAPGAPSSNAGLLIGLGVAALALVGVLLLARRH